MFKAEKERKEERKKERKKKEKKKSATYRYSPPRREDTPIIMIMTMLAAAEDLIANDC